MCGLLACDIMGSWKWVPVFQRNILLPSLWSILKIEVAFSSKTLVSTSKNTWHHNTEDCSLLFTVQIVISSKNLKTYKLQSSSFFNFHHFLVTSFLIQILSFVKCYEVKSSIFWEIMPCSLLKINRHFGGTCRLHLHGWRISQARNQLKSGLAFCFHAGFLLGLFFDPEHGGDMYPWNIS
jgi:hypothetical protein